MRDILKSLRVKLVQFRRGVLNLVRWFSVIWKDRDYDYCFMEAVLMKKLEFMAEEFSDEPEKAQRMLLVVKLLQRAYDGHYEMEHTKYYEQDYYINQFRQLIWLKPVVDDLGFYFDKYPLVYAKVMKNFTYKDREHLSYSETRIKIAALMANYNHERCRELAYKIISTNLHHWWN